MMKNSNREDLCLLILLPANDAARIYCNQIEKTSLICQIQMDNNHIEKGLIYTCIKQQRTKIRSARNQNAEELPDRNQIRSELETSEKKTSLTLLNSLKNLTIKTKTSTDLIKHRRVKINKKLLSSPSPITVANVPRTFSLWYKKKK